jgi:hypothetical protein
MPSGTTQDVRISPPPSKEKDEPLGHWGYLKNRETGARVLYWDRDLKFDGYTGIPIWSFLFGIKVEYELKEVSLVVNKKNVGNICIAIITKLK